MLTAEHRLLQESVRRVVEEEIAPRAASVDRESRFPRESLWALARLGVFDLPALDGKGRGGDDLLGFALVVEEVARVSPATAWVYVVHVSTTLAIAGAATQEEESDLLGPLRTGERLATFAFTEPDAGADFSALRTSAAPRSGGYVLNGRKSFISVAGEADLYLVLARTPREDGSLAHSMLRVDRDTPGFVAERRHESMGMRGIGWGELRFDDCRIPEANLVGEPGRGLRVLFGMAGAYLLGAAALSLGIAEGAFGETVRHLRERRRTPEGPALGELESLQFRIADLGARVEAIRALIYRACLEERPGGTLALAAKLFASETAIQVVVAAQQLHGATGYASESTFQRLLRDAFAIPLHFENNDFLRRVLGRALLRP